MRRAIVLAVLFALLAVAPASATLPWLGQPVTAWAPSDLPVFAMSAAVNPQGTVLYVLSSTGIVYEYSTTTGKYVGGFGAFGTGPGEFHQPSAITVDPYGNVWIADTGNGRVQKLSATGKPLLSQQSVQPVGIAAGTAEVYVLSGVLRGVGELSWSGKDVGGYIATFPNGYDLTGHYAAPTNSAAAIAGDSAGHSAVIGTTTQGLNDPDRPSCKSPLSTLDPLPDPLVAPAMTVFDDHGTALREAYPFNAGAICWTDNPVRWSYGLTGRHGLGIAVDPVTNNLYATTDEGSGPWWVTDDAQEHLGIWDPSVGPTPETTGLSTSKYGPVRAFAIGCDSSLYMVTFQRIEKFRVANPDTSRCHARNPALDQAPTLQPALGKAPPPSGKATNGLAAGTVFCSGARRCAGRVSVALQACETCRPLVILHKLMSIGAGQSKPLVLHPPAAVARRLAHGLPVVARARVGTRPSTTFPLRAPTTLTATCGAGLALSGTVTPARAGLRVAVALTGPTGGPQTLTARTDARGHWSLQPPAPADGTWTATASLPGTRALSPAQAGCGLLVGPLPAPLVGAPPPGRDLQQLDLTLTCPAEGAVGEELTPTGQLAPADVGVVVTFTGGGTEVTATSSAGGAASARLTPAQAGDYVVVARASLAGTQLERRCTIAVHKVATSLSAACSPTGQIPWPGNKGRVSGTLTPGFAGATVTVTFTRPGQPTQTQTATTDASGAYSVQFEPPAPNDWSAAAAYAGDGAHTGASAPACVLHYG